MTVEGYPHLERDENGVVRIAGAGIKVRIFAAFHVDQLLEAEQLQRQYPHLALSQIHDALAYYYDHKAAIDAENEAGERMAQALLLKLESRESMARLRAIKAAIAQLDEQDSP